MKTLVCLLALTVVPTLVHAEDVWRWKDANGTTCYSNQSSVAPPGAAVVTTRLVIEATRLPDREPDLVMEDGAVIPASERPEPRRHRIYSERRLRFGCYASNVLFAGGWAHPDDITLTGNCLPYLLGPEAWLNAARAELGLREHGLDWRQLVPMYLAQSRATPEPRLTAVSHRD